MTVQELKALREHKFIETRTLIKQWVTLVVTNARAMDPRLLEGVTIPAGDTAEEILPSLFAPKFDPEQYARECAPLNALVARMNEVAVRLNEEALKCLS